MKKRINKPCFLKFLVWLILLGTISYNSIGQEDSIARKILDKRGELYIRFIRPGNLSVQSLANRMSIDKISRQKSGNEITAYLNSREYEEFIQKGIKYEILTAPSIQLAATMCSDLTAAKNWNCYPDYNQYVQLMQSFQDNYPDLCKRVEFGQSEEGRKLLAVKISDNVNSDEEEPDFLYTSTMHGDEVTGYVLMLRLINYLLTNYGTDQRITDLVNSTEIWINPLSNPDGTFNSGNTTVTGATRFNSNGIDLNRNYPYAFNGTNPNAVETENLAMIDFMKQNHFVFAANLHGGEEVVNYPWDYYLSSEKIHADDNWYIDVSREYVDTVHANSDNYMISLDNGITNGGDWYVVYGSRQDYNNYFLHNRETTMEISSIKMPDASTLPNYWNYNFRSFLNYINEVHSGIYGKITDQDGNPLRAKITLLQYDKDSSEVYSNPVNGMYYRMLSDGTYHINATLAGYSQADSVVTVSNGTPELVNLVLKKDPVFINEPENNGFNVLIAENPVNEILKISIQTITNDRIKFTITDMKGAIISENNLETHIGSNKFFIDVKKLQSGIYFCKFGNNQYQVTQKIVKVE
ncbi:MAG: M14 family zinc carboxypeptidase [Bacteroidales bacterium]